MPSQTAKNRATADARAGKSASTQAGEFVREEVDRVRHGEHGARSAKQAIAIGLSEARRAGVKLPPPPGTKSAEGKPARKQSSGSSESSAKRSRASLAALRKEPTGTTSPGAMSRQARESAQQRGAASRKSAAAKAVRTKGTAGLKSAAKKAARTRQRPA
jgi:hypothetical protein